MRMGSRVLGAATCVVALLGWVTADAARAQGKRNRKFRTTGLVKVTKNDGGKIAAVLLHADRGELYHVTLDKKGLALGGAMSGEKSRVSGTVLKQDGKNWLTVQAYTDLEMAAAHEQWRRMRCNYCVVAPALVNATIPRELRGAQAIDGRPFSFKAQIRAWSRDAKFLWAATDGEILQIDLAARRRVKSYARAEGLPDQVPHELLSDGTTLWIVHQAGVAALTIGKGRVVDLPALRCNFARLAAGKGCVWVIADTGTFRLKDAGTPPDKFPALPTAARITKNVVRGLWLPQRGRLTARFLHTPVCVGDRVYVGSYGDLYGLDGGKWTTVAQSSWGLTAGAGRIWFLSAKGVGEYQPEAKAVTVHAPPGIPQGRCRRVLASESAVWVAVEPQTAGEGVVGGGLARLDLRSRKWQTWAEINGRKADRVRCFQETDGALWALNIEGQYKVKPAHPGMAYVKRKVFDATGLCLHRFLAKGRRWESTPLGRPTFERRLVIGQDGARGHDVVAPQAVEEMCIGASRVFGVTRLFPKSYFCGYYQSVEQLAVRQADGAGWTKKFEHRPDALGLQGEQPAVLNISNTGRMVLEAVGHDNVLGLFGRQGICWAVTEGRISYFDERAGRWHTVAEPPFRFYWRPTAGFDDGRHLYVGSDRGLLCRLSLETGRFERLGCLRQRSISRIAKDPAGGIVVTSQPAPLGILPVQLRGTLAAQELVTARFDGKTWTQADVKAMPKAGVRSWFVKRIKKRHRMDKSRGNFLWGPSPKGPAPKLYVKGVFYPRFLCTGPDGDRLWLSTYSGLIRLDGVKKVLGVN